MNRNTVCMHNYVYRRRFYSFECIYRIYTQMNRNTVCMHNYVYRRRFYSFECIYAVCTIMHTDGVSIHLGVYIYIYTIYIHSNESKRRLYAQLCIQTAFLFILVYISYIYTHPNESKLLPESIEVGICALDYLSHSCHTSVTPLFGAA